MTDSVQEQCDDLAVQFKPYIDDIVTKAGGIPLVHYGSLFFGLVRYCQNIADPESDVSREVGRFIAQATPGTYAEMFAKLSHLAKHDEPSA